MCKFLFAKGKGRFLSYLDYRDRLFILTSRVVVTIIVTTWMSCIKSTLCVTGK